MPTVARVATGETISGITSTLYMPECGSAATSSYVDLPSLLAGLTATTVSDNKTQAAIPSLARDMASNKPADVLGQIAPNGGIGQLGFYFDVSGANDTIKGELNSILGTLMPGQKVGYTFSLTVVDKAAFSPTAESHPATQYLFTRVDRNAEMGVTSEKYVLAASRQTSVSVNSNASERNGLLDPQRNNGYDFIDNAGTVADWTPYTGAGSLQAQLAK